MSQGTSNPSVFTASSQKVASVWSGDFGASDEGSFFIATSTPGTPIATTTSVVDDATGATTHAQQRPTLVIQNSWPVGGYNIYLRYIKMVITQVPTSATSWKYAMRLDPYSGKITTAGTTLPNGPYNVNSNSGQPSKALIQAGTVVTTDSTSSPQQRLVANGQIANAIPVTLDEWTFTFGQPISGADSNGTVTNAKRLSFPCAPIVIAPTWTFTLEMWGASNAAAPTYDFEVGFIERPAGQ